MALIVGLVRIAQEKVRAEKNLARAGIYFRDARNMLDRFGVQLAEQLSDVPGAEQVRRELLRETLAYYQNFVEEAQDDPNLRAEMALTYGRVAALTADRRPHSSRRPKWQSGTPSPAPGCTSMPMSSEPSGWGKGRGQGFGSTLSASGRHSVAHRHRKLPGTTRTASPVEGRGCSL